MNNCNIQAKIQVKMCESIYDTHVLIGLQTK